jgi:hypothetical protein
MTRIMLHCIKIKEKFCALHDEKGGTAGQADYGDLAHGHGAQGVYRASPCSGFPLGLIQG